MVDSANEFWMKNNVEKRSLRVCRRMEKKKSRSVEQSEDKKDKMERNGSRFLKWTGRSLREGLKRCLRGFDGFMGSFRRKLELRDDMVQMEVGML